MKTKKPVVSIFTSNWGHGSIAQAVKSALEPLGYKIYFNHIEAEKFSAQTYSLTYHFFPSLQKIPFRVTNTKSLQNVINTLLTKKYKDEIKDLLIEQKPDIVINTYFAFNRTLGRLVDKAKFLFINIVADPWTFHKLTLNDKAYNFLFDKKACGISQRLGVDKTQCVPSGWFVREKFLKKYNKRASRNKFGLDCNITNLCVVGGSDGTYSILKVIPALIEVKKPVQIVFVCGNNKNLLNSVKMFKKVFLRVGSKVEILPVGFTDNIDEYVKAADLVIGKAGPNLLFETVATQTPFFAISHISGQEDGNLEIIKKFRLGYVEEKPMRAAKLIRKIIENPKMLRGFEKHLTKMAEYNKNSYKVLREFIKEKLQAVS